MLTLMILKKNWGFNISPVSSWSSVARGYQMMGNYILSPSSLTVSNKHSDNPNVFLYSNVSIERSLVLSLNFHVLLIRDSSFDTAPFSCQK